MWVIWGYYLKLILLRYQELSGLMVELIHLWNKRPSSIPNSASLAVTSFLSAPLGGEGSCSFISFLPLIQIYK